MIWPPAPNAAVAQTDAVIAFRAMAERRARDYDRTRGIRPDQLLILLDVAERTGYGLGQLLATGQHESAHTWNDFVRPPLSGGRVGVAAGVWQFQPATFARVLELHGAELLTLSEAEPQARRRRLDLGFGPFCDSHVRLIIRDAMDGLRGADDDELLLLRHGFGVLALSKYLLSTHSGAKDPVEDYLFHFLGAGEGRRILTLARGPSRNTRTVKPKPLEPTASTAPIARAPVHRPLAPRRADSLPPGPELVLDALPGYYRSLVARGPAVPRTSQPRIISRTGVSSIGRPAWPAPHGYDYDSAVVTSNLRMFYRDGPGRSDPYTWAEFLDHLARLVRADRQPKLVRANYGVGFVLNGGDMPHWRHRPDQPGETLRLYDDDGKPIERSKRQVLGALSRTEMRDYQRRLATLLAFGEAKPGAVLSDAAGRTLYRLGLLHPDADDTAPTLARTLADLGTDMGPGWGTVLRSDQHAVREALAAFRALVGKDAPKDPAAADLLPVAERIALEVYGRRIEGLLAELPTEPEAD